MLSYNGKEEGKGVNAQNYEMAFYWFEKSAELGDSVGMNNLGKCYYHGKGTTQNYEMAFQWYQKSAELGNSCGMNNLGNCYYHEKGITLNYEMAFHWLQKSVELGNPYGMYGLGVCYYNGEGTKGKDYIKAFKFFKIKRRQRK